ncbi:MULTISPECIES: LysM peptidoglycan-binding domain-containing protein [Actinomycetes]|uniref:LysM domain-containing protein n=2 Tax=Actinomycetes TaxID=1760 RepID=A0ABP6LLX3_9MICC|nr:MULTISPECIES: LysM peptidoglycan-binding domain-containing protein [unclassified Nesterenkonia]MDS2171395.1 LysM peptidoglycan-binding domain-containing protein [Nesterenkonia sp. CL21]
MRHSHTSFTTSAAGQAYVASSAGAPGRLNLTRRGRLVILGVPALTLLVAALVGVALLVGSFVNMAQATSHGAPGVAAVEVTVAPGDTLWSVASGLGTGEDTQVLITQIAELNDLTSSEIHPGQTLYVPVAD